MESATKYLSGHSDVMAGAVVGSRDRVAAVRSAQIDTGATLGPFAAFLVLRGIATLAVRMERQSRTALALATFLERRDGVAAVTYPGLPSHPQRGGRRADPRPRRRDAVGRPRRRPGGGPGVLSTPSRSRSGPPAWAASTRWSSTRRRRRHRSLDAAVARRRGHHRGPPAGLGRASRTRRTSSPTSRQALDAANAASPSARPPRPRPSRRRSPPRREAAIATIAARRSAARPAPGLPTRIANAVWGLLTSVDFAVVQIIVLACSPSSA